ncbi:MAG: ATP-dependent RecD-like DNA helicase [Puniceicoccales bacterium]|jgi:exodeoxyribonuclease V alpha subunit|nr:ATP-dependent RecD-like DNA helicase [Puniceicoccales bacterium]
MSVVVQGSLERILFRCEENAYMVGRLRPSGTAPGEAVVFCGTFPSVQCGEQLSLEGEWKEHPTYGRRLEVRAFEVQPPSDLYGLERYLAHGFASGIGKSYAARIVQHFGPETFEVLSQDIGRLREVPGIGARRVARIRRAWEEQAQVRDLFIFLQSYEISQSLCQKLHKTYGDRARSVLEKDPYRVAREVAGIGFKTADRMARNLGIPDEASVRLEAGLFHSFEMEEMQGHTCLGRDALVRTAQNLLEVEPGLIEAQLDLLQQYGKIHLLPNGRLQLAHFKVAEETIAFLLKRLLQGKSPALGRIDGDAAVAWAQRREGFVFAEEQRAGLRSALTKKVSVLTGGPGTGKTTLLRALVAILRAKHIAVALAAPTGRAAQRLAEATGTPAKTIHKLLQFRTDTEERHFRHDEGCPLNVDYLIVDEMSMLDTRLAASLLRAVPETACVLFVGDSDQLPSVGAGNVLSDLMRSGILPVVRLRKVFRQDDVSSIVHVAHAIISGDTTLSGVSADLSAVQPKDDFHFILADSPEDCIEKTKQLCLHCLPSWYEICPRRDVQLLVPLYRGSVGINRFNEVFQSLYAREGTQVPWMHLRLGDKVIQTRNNYEKGIFNGDLGFIRELRASERKVVVDFDGQDVELGAAEIGDLSLAYAISIHKSQGSEFPIVVMPLLFQHYVMLQRNLLYTGISRGRHKVFLIGDPKAYATAVRNRGSVQRSTGLRDLLRSMSLPAEGHGS